MSFGSIRWVDGVSNPCLGYQGIVGFHFHSYGVLCSSQLQFMIATGFCSGTREVPTFKGKGHDVEQLAVLACKWKSLHFMCLVFFTSTGENTIELRVRKSSKITRGLFYVVLKTFWKSKYCLKFRITFFKIHLNLWTVEVSNIKHIDLYFSCFAIKIIADWVVRLLSYLFNLLISLKHCFLILTIYLCIWFARSWG